MTSKLFAFNVATEISVDDKTYLVDSHYDPQKQVWIGANEEFLASQPCAVGQCSSGGGTIDDWAYKDVTNTFDCGCDY